MSEVTLNIVGNTSGGSSNGNTSNSSPLGNNGSGNTTGSTSSNSQPWNISSDRLLSDIRREMQTKGVALIPGTSTYNQLLKTIQEQQKNKLDQSISDHFSPINSSLINEYYDKRDEFTNRINAERRNALQGITDEDSIDSINTKYDRMLRREQRLLDAEFTPRFTSVENEENAAKLKAEEELTRAIRELIDETKRGNQGSYIQDLRNRYREAIYNRDNASTKEEAQLYSRQARDINRQLAEATTVKDRNIWGSSGIFGPLTPVFSIGQTIGQPLLQMYNMPFENQMAHIQSLGQFSQGDPFGAILNENALKRSNYQTIGSVVGTILGGAIGGILAPFTGGGSIALGLGVGAGLGSGAGNLIAGWLGSSETKGADVLAKLGQSYQQLENRIKAFNDITMITAPTGEGGELLGDFEGQRDYLINLLTNGWIDTRTGLTNRDFGQDAATFAQNLSTRIKARGIWDDNLTDAYNRAMMSEGLERVFNLNTNSLSQLGVFDRYRTKDAGYTNTYNDANQAVTNLFNHLSSRGVTGMSDGHFLRGNEYVGYLQQLMSSQKSWNLRPNMNRAVRQLATLQDIYGDGLDERGIQMMSRLDNAVTNPQQGMASVITNDVIQNLYPGTRGNLLEIRKAQYSDEKRPEIQKAMLNRLIKMYGDVNTTSGYMALSQYTGIENPYELEKVVNKMRNGLTSVQNGGEGAQVQAVSKLTGYTPQLSQDIIEAQDQALNEINKNSKNIEGINQMIFDFLKNNIRDIIKELNGIKGKIN